MKEKGLPQNFILKELEKRLRSDFTYDSGRSIGSMCSRPHPFARRLHSRYLDRNLGDSGLSPALAEIEKETVQMLGGLLSNPRASGCIVTGGTEANILALWAARRTAGKERGEIVASVSAHYSIDKAADLLGLKMVKIGLDSKFQVDAEAVKRAINPNTIAIVGVAGTTGLGVVDPIEELSEIAAEKRLFLHVDAAFGGFTLPFLKELGISVPEFDFTLRGVSSITIDPHKMGLAPIPAGGILFRDEDLRRRVAWNVAYLAGGETEQATLVGTRSGASVIAVWALLKHLGKEGYRGNVKRCMKLTIELVERIKKIEGLQIVTEPTMNIVGLRSDVFDLRQIVKELRLRGWAVSLFPEHIRIVVMPQIQKHHIERFLEDLYDVTDKLRSQRRRSSVVNAPIQAH